DGAHFAISSIGGSGAEICSDVYHSYYHNCDMYIPAKYGIQQVVGDTAGPAGLMMGLRSIPSYLHICSEMEKRCPDAVLLSHSNPMAVLCRAMNKYSKINVIGICHGVQATVMQAAEMLDVPAHELECVWIGTNHYYWIVRAGHQGRDLTEELAGRAARLGKQDGADLCHRLSNLYGCKVGYPGAGHLVEFYSWATRVPSQDDLPYHLAAEARAHGFDASVPMPKREKPTPAVRRAFFRHYQGILDGVAPSKPGDDIHGEGIARMIAAIRHGRREVFIVNVPNGSAVPNLPPHALVEIEGVTDSMGVRGIIVGDCPPVLKGILEKRFAWQELVVDAAVTGDRNLALQALMIDEMAIEPGKAESMLEELLTASRDMLPRFFGRRRQR
ncbi:MAG: hypothetical protein HQ559_11050, partial [Lentisphaerae bacterium]|nr:hypothetical protein [Lentisphaerota bacterium]